MSLSILSLKAHHNHTSPCLPNDHRNSLPARAPRPAGLFPLFPSVGKGVADGEPIISESTSSSPRCRHCVARLRFNVISPGSHNKLKTNGFLFRYRCEVATRARTFLSHAGIRPHIHTSCTPYRSACTRTRQAHCPSAPEGFRNLQNASKVANSMSAK